MQRDRRPMRVEDLSEREMALIMQAKVEADTPYNLDDLPAADAEDEAIFGRALDLVTLVQRDGTATLAELAAALDHLASAFAEAPEGRFVADAEARLFAPVDRELIARRFPELGLYAAGNPLDLDGGLLVADAVDDLLDITTQMQEFLALSDNADEALRQLHALAGHWMAHLRSLSRYLHARRYGW